jgi:hypothetical protein
MKVQSGMKAIRINGTEILTGKQHYALLRKFQKRENLTDNQIDAMFDEDKIEFGQVFLIKGQLEFSTDNTRQTIYKNLYDVAAMRNTYFDEDSE